MSKPLVLITDRGSLAKNWPYTRKQLEDRLQEKCEVRFVDAEAESFDDLPWEEVAAFAYFGGKVTQSQLYRATKLQCVGGITDAKGPNFFSALCDRNIPFIDATRAWGQSVAECGFGLILCALRKLPHWHKKLADGSFNWEFQYGQFCDDPKFVNGDLGTKRVGVVGLGQIGGRIASWCAAFGADVYGYDPFLPEERFAEIKTKKTELKELAEQSEILVIAVPPTPSAENMVNAELVDSLQKGSIVMTITRTAAIDTEALRKRVLADELFWSADVFDIEPIPADDPILNRENVVHVPHIAGRTKDSNLRLANIIADDFLRIMNGEKPVSALTRKAVEIRTKTN